MTNNQMDKSDIIAPSNKRLLDQGNEPKKDTTPKFTLGQAFGESD